MPSNIRLFRITSLRKTQIPYNSPLGVTGGKQSSKPFTCKRLKYKNRNLERSQHPHPERKTANNETEREGKMVTFDVKTTRDSISEKSGNEITRFRKTKKPTSKGSALIDWRARRDSNPRPMASEATTLIH